MKRLLLLRHAKAAPAESGGDDHERPLDPRGERAAAAMGVFLAQDGVRPDVVLCSPSRRTRQTWERVWRELDGEPAVSFERGLYLAPAAALLERLRGLDATATTALVVGHNPGIEDLAVALAGAGDEDALARLRTKVPTCAVADLWLDAPHWAALAPGAARLRAFVVPKDLL